MAENNTKILYDTKYLQLKSTTSPSGGEWVYAHRPNAKNVVIIVPLIVSNGRKQVLFLREKRPPMYAENRGEYNIGLVAGLVGDEREGEDILDAAKAELLEESGLVADKITIVAENINSSAGCVSEVFTILVAEISDPTPIQQPVTDGGIIVERILIDVKDIPEFLKSEQKAGNTISGQTLAGLYFI